MAQDQVAQLFSDDTKGPANDTDLNQPISITDAPIDDEGPIEDIGDGSEEQLVDIDTEDEVPAAAEEEDFTVPPRRKEILAKYPDLMKDFPYIDKALYREKAYSEIFPTLADAREAQEKLSAFDGHSEELKNGSFETILTDLKTSDKEAFSKTVNNYLENLSKVDNDAYLHVITNVYKTGIRNMLQMAHQNQDADLQGLAFSLNEYLFGTKRFTAPTGYGNSSMNPEIDEVKREKETFAQERLTTKQGDVTALVDRTLRHNIDVNLDPKNQMTPFVKKNANKEAMDLVNNQMKEDRRFQSQLEKMWKDAEKSKFPEERIKAIRNAMISRAKSILPQAIRKVRAEALAGSRERGNGDPGPIRGGRPRSAPQQNSSNKGTSNNQGGSKLKIPDGVKPHDWLMQD